MSRTRPRKPTERTLLAEMKYPRRNLWILLAVNLVLRLLLIFMNSAEYTDGILQITQFSEPSGIWPPLYTGVCWPFGTLFKLVGIAHGDVWAGRLVSAVASSFAVWPLYRLAARASGTRAALLGGMLYTVAPVSLRWAPRVMTDSLFAMLFWWACERLCFASDERDEKTARMALGLGIMCAVFASLTRYQGIMLAPPALVVGAMMYRRFGRWPVAPLSSLLGFLALPAWAWVGGFIHNQQFQGRLFGGGVSGFVEATHAAIYVTISNLEPFILLAPYYLGYPVAIAILAGIFWARPRRGFFIVFLTIYVTVLLLVVQSAFSSFQERYMLPIFGLLWPLGGVGLFSFQERLRRFGPRWFAYILILTMTWSLFMAGAVLLGQREVFGDIRRAAEFVAQNTPRGAPIYTTEYYPSGGFVGTKFAYYSGRKPTWISDKEREVRSLVLPTGSLVILSTAYSGEAYYEVLSERYELEEVVLYKSSVLPLFPEIMATQGTAQNPAAWLKRYDWQLFQTAVFRVRGPRR